MNSNQNLKLLCLHGHPGSSEAMQVFVQHFQSCGVEAIAPDLRGYGKFKAQSSFTMMNHIEDLGELLANDPDCENTDYLILGWSLGGILAIELALKAIASQYAKSEISNPETSRPLPKIVGLILIATAAKPRSNLPPVLWWEYINLLIAVGLHRILSKLSPQQNWHINWFGKRSLIKYLIQQHTKFAYDQISTVGARAYLQTSRYAHQALSQAIKQGYDRNLDLEKIQIPCLVIAAEQDRHITSASTAETAQLLPNSEFICYPNVAHLLPWEIGDRLLTDIDSWCDRHIKQPKR